MTMTIMEWTHTDSVGAERMKAAKMDEEYVFTGNSNVPACGPVCASGN